MRNANAWVVNGLLAVILVLLGAYFYRVCIAPAQAAGGGWETNGMMAMHSGLANDRLVLIDTKKQNIMVYRTQGTGKFRLTGARSYKYDLELPDTGGNGAIEGRGISFSDCYKAYKAAKK